jgi:putative colanic acid biosynthesis UDP-glucose lipid carrier transferase
MSNTGTIRPNHSLLDIMRPIVDGVCIYAAMCLVKTVARGYVESAAHVTALTAIVLFMMISQLTGLHRRWSSWTSNQEILAVAWTWVGTLIVLTVVGFLTRYSEVFSRSVIIAWAVLTPCLIGLTRMVSRLIQRDLSQRGIGVRRVAIAGFNPLGQQVAKNIEEDAGLGLKLSGYYDDRAHFRQAETADGEDAAESEIDGGLDTLVEKAKRGGVDIVLITLPMRAESRIRYVLDRLSDSTVSVYIVPDFFVFELLHSRWTSVGGLPAVSVFENPFFGVDGISKRVADFGLATMALLIAAVPMLLISIAIKCSSRGPVFFRQRRYGLDGREIRVWKFRSMRTCDDGPVVRQATKNDSRITPLGSILRKTSLDELPQLFNVIEGSMSLVGPRPHASAHNEEFRGRIRGYMLRHKVKPGITGLAQVSGCRGETDTIEKMEKRIEWDHRYIRDWSLWLDIKILAKTLLVAWRQPEAY